MKKIWTKFKDVIYIISIIGIGCGWYVSYKISKIKNEMKDQRQDDKIEMLVEENRKLKLGSEKNKDYAEENANNIDWIIRIFIESD